MIIEMVQAAREDLVIASRARAGSSAMILQKEDLAPFARRASLILLVIHAKMHHDLWFPEVSI